MRRVARLMPPIMVVLIAVSLAFGAVSGVAGAAAAPSGTPDVPSPSECTVAPRSLSNVVSFYVAALATPETARRTASPAAFTLPQGKPADAATTAAIEAAVRELMACANANDLLREFALWTDHYLQVAAAEDVASGDVTAAADAAQFFGATPTPAATGTGVALVSIRDVQVLPDGRIAAIVSAIEPGSASPNDGYMIFVHQGDRYLLDDTVDVPGGTPAA